MMKKVILSLLISGISCYYSQAADKENLVISIAKYKHDKTCAISYTFDDGMKEHYTLVLPQLEKNNFKGTFWICGEFIENNSGSWLTWAQVKEMAEKGHEMSNHSWSHKNLTQIPIEEVATEIKKNDRILFEQTGQIPRTFCYPYNAYNPEVLELAATNRVATRIKEYAIGTKSTPEDLDQWVKDLLNSGNWSVAMIHGITEGYDAFPSPDILWNHLDKVKAQEDKIWVGTFCEVAAYIQEQENIKLDITEKEKSITIVPQLSLNKELFNESLTMIIKKPGINKIKVQQGDKTLPVQVGKEKILFDFDPHGKSIVINYK